MVGCNEQSVLHLQFADDTIIFCESEVDQLLNVKRVLCYFQVISGFKINFFKSSLFGFNIDKEILADWANKISCKVESLPTTYLGLSLGNRLNSIKTWEPVVAKLEQRMTCWKANLLRWRVGSLC